MTELPQQRAKLAYLQQSLQSDILKTPSKSFGEEIQISGLSYDSRHIRSGDLFFALTGEVTDGHRYIQEALERGALAVVGERPVENLPVPYIQVPDSRRALSRIAAAFYGYPARKLTVIGVTGTDGKTTTANLIYQILLAAGFRAGLISTVNAVIGEEIIDTGFHVTTPEATDIQRYLFQMVSSSLSHVVLEATSHGLAQHRVADGDFVIGVVTNITHEHLDYHHSYEAYRSAKASLFDLVAAKKPKSSPDVRCAVVNRDDSSYSYLSDYIQKSWRQEYGEANLIRYGLKGPAEVSAESIATIEEGITFVAVGADFRLPVLCHLWGEYNVSNCLAAIASTVQALGIDPIIAVQGINNLKSLPGRMELIDLEVNFLPIVDFAHTPNALRRSLVAVRQLPEYQARPGRVIAVFGSAGLRDKEKRRMMAEISAELADITILTAEDPRTEPLDGILVEMSLGCESKGGVEGQTFWRIRDRGEAIRLAVGMARAGDVVIALGKGHEQSMCFGETEYAWDDRLAMRAAISELSGSDGPEMPYLPTQDEAG
jgi:UDP-N-acetylmuramoyl-L-alanyl-D-glutamate--2,6-diaminopimelate ligase